MYARYVPSQANRELESSATEKIPAANRNGNQVYASRSESGKGTNAKQRKRSEDHIEALPKEDESVTNSRFESRPNKKQKLSNTSLHVANIIVPWHYGKDKLTTSPEDALSEHGAEHPIKSERVTDSRSGSILPDRRSKRKRAQKEEDVLSSSRNGIGATDQPLDDKLQGDDKNKHSNLMSKFRKSLQNSEHKAQQQVADSPPDFGATVEPQDLVPIPQPKDIHSRAVPAYSTRPRWITSPMAVDDESRASFASLSIDESLCKLLQKRGFQEALPIQAAVLPLLLPIPSQHPGDVCVSAATGSGKTLAYTLPIVQSLRQTKAEDSILRAIIVVPTRELASQLTEELRLCTKGSNLRYACVTGNTSIHTEREMLIGVRETFNSDKHESACKRVFKDLNCEFCSDDEALEAEFEANNIVLATPGHIPIYHTMVDILVCTPGRLVDHLKSTRGFGVTSLEWLVLDEVDRLLDDSFQEWTLAVNEALTAKLRLEEEKAWESNSRSPFFNRVRKILLSATMTSDIDKLGALQLWNPKLVVMNVTSIDQQEGSFGVDLGNELKIPGRLREHATPVEEPTDKPLVLIALLDLLNEARMPNGIDLTSHSRAETLVENSADDSDSMSEYPRYSNDSSAASDSSDASSRLGTGTRPSKKVTEQKRAIHDATCNTLVFTRSSENAVRLSRLLSYIASHLEKTANLSLPQLKVSSLTKSSSARERNALVNQFKSRSERKVAIENQTSGMVHNILVSTDRSSRGLDLPMLNHVINYDMPSSVTNYIHRIGRTARAGREGHAWTLVEPREAKWFWNVIAKGLTLNGRKPNEERIARGHGVVERIRVGTDTLESQELRDAFEHALSTLKSDVVDGSKA